MAAHFNSTTNEVQSMKIEEKVQLSELSERESRTAKDYYAESYSHTRIHEEMLKDVVRTNTYKKAIKDNFMLFQGKVVLDVGCGTGILSMFAADAGAKHVYGVDMADIADVASKIVTENGFADRVTIIKGKIEEIELPVDQVDIIVSEWMGYFLLYESMLDTVIYARDKWLVPDGIIMPDNARLHICAIEDDMHMNQKLRFWDGVYGYSMKSMKKKVLVDPLVDWVPYKNIVSHSACIFEIDLYTCTVEDLDFEAEFQIEFTKRQFAHAITAFFDVEFKRCHIQCGFTTAPFSSYTHWKQTTFYLNESVRAEKGGILAGQIKVRKHPKNHRSLIIDLETTTDYNHTQAREYMMR